MIIAESGVNFCWAPAAPGPFEEHSKSMIIAETCIMFHQHGSVLTTQIMFQKTSFLPGGVYVLSELDRAYNMKNSPQSMILAWRRLISHRNWTALTI